MEIKDPLGRKAFGPLKVLKKNGAKEKATVSRKAPIYYAAMSSRSGCLLKIQPKVRESHFGRSLLQKN